MMTNKALQTINQYNMLEKGDTVAVCLSGGADSMALFHFLCMEAKKLEIQVIALHFNHGLRKESDDEEVFVQEYCKKMNCLCVTAKGNMHSQKKPQGVSLELWARQLRYEFFYQMAQKYHAKIATAHTLSDHAETILFHITRGSGIKGAVGIPAVRENIIRPLLACTRNEIEDYCRQNGVPFVTDETNFKDIYSRNKIRLHVVPVLKQINPKAEESIAFFASECQEIHTFLTQLSDTLYRKSLGVNGFDIHVINQEDPVVIKQFLRTLLIKYDCLSKDNIQALFAALSLKNYTRQLSKQVFCTIKNDRLFFYKQKTSGQICQNSQQRPILLDETIKFLDNEFVFSVVSHRELQKIKENDKNYLTYYANYDKIKSAIILRTKKTGDTFTFSNRKVTKSLKKLFIEDKIPQTKRERFSILSDETGNVIWLESYGVNKSYQIEESTKNILLIKQLSFR